VVVGGGASGSVGSRVKRRLTFAEKQIQTAMQKDGEKKKMVIFDTAYFQFFHKFKQKFYQTNSFFNSLSVQLLL
jgi:hypothetical protein